MILVNIGCGRTYHREWVNLDFEPATSEVRRCDVCGRLPFRDGSVDVVYHSHLLEHLGSAEAARFLAECHRILRRGGIMRVAVPDLEGIARSYLRELEEAKEGRSVTLYEWSRMELIDQAARSVSGGEMAPFLNSLDPDQLVAVRTRAGHEIDNVLEAMESRPRRELPGLNRLWRRARWLLVEWFALVVGGRRLQACVQEGIFRGSGEVHRVMYDRVSLARRLIAAGFLDPVSMPAHESRIPEFARYALDVTEGVIRKPDSLFMEATRP